jgi:hypothetical protein
MKKSFKTIDILPVASGLTLYNGGFAGIQEVMDHFYPGIMTIGCAAMGKDAAEEVKKQLPDLTAKLAEPFQESEWEEWSKGVLAQLPETMELEGPTQVDCARVKKNFNDFGKGIRR